MTVSTTTNRASYSGNGSTAAFAYGFKIFADADLTVIIRSSAGVETTKTLTTHYTVSGAGTDSGGNVTFTSGNIPASGETVVILRKLTLTQGTDYVANDPFPAESHEDALDRLTMISQQHDEAIGRALKVSQTNVIATSEFTTSATDRANKLLSFDGSGDLTVTEGKIDTVTISASGLSAGATPTATATYTAASGALALALGIPAGATGATGSTGASGGGLSDVVLDTTPQLGGDLDMNGQDIVTTSNADIELNPNGTGKTVLKGNTNPGTIVFNCEANTHGQTVKAQAHTAGVTNTLTLPAGGDGELVSTVATQQLTNKTIPDDEKLFFGTGNDGYIEYDENGDDRLKIGGTNIEFEKAVIGKTDPASITGSTTLDFATNQNFVLTLTGAVTLANPTTELVGQTGFIVFIQDGSGNRTVSLDTQYKTVGGVNTVTLSGAANAIDIVPYVVSAADTILLGASQLAFSQGVDMSGPVGSSQWIYNPSTSFYDHTIDQSLRFDATGYLTRNTGEAGNTTVYTTSFWVKRSGLTSNQFIFSAGPWNGGNNYEGIRFVNDDTLRAILTVSNSTVANFSTNAVFRDVSAWYHVVWQRNGQAYKIYVNGTEQTYSASTFSSNPSGYLTADTEQLISGRLDHLQDLDGYLAEFNFVDGSALDPTSFGETKDGVWIPKAYSGSYGTTGFHLTFSDDSSIGADTSGLSHNFTVSDIVASDVVPDSPSNNFATANPLAVNTSSPWTAEEGNLKILSSSNNKNIRGNFLMQSGKWYWETRRHNANNSSAQLSDGLGIALPSGDISNTPYTSTTNWSYYSHTGKKRNGSTNASYGDTWNSAGDIIGVAFDADNGVIWFSKNGTWQNSATTSEIAAGTTTNAAFTGLTDTGGYVCNWWRTGGTNAEELDLNFGQNPSFNAELTGGDVGTQTDSNGNGLFKYAPPSGFLALCTVSLPDPTIGPGQTEQADDHFNTVLYTGDGSTSNAITTVGHQPDWLWIKQRGATRGHQLMDSVRGAAVRLQSHGGTAESVSALSSFDSDGFTVTVTGSDGSTLNGTNINSGVTNDFVAWSWKAGGAPTTDNSNAAGAEPTAGSVKIDGVNKSGAFGGSPDIAVTRLSANTVAGFSIIKYTGVTANPIKIPHGLNSAPEAIIIKRLDGGDSWMVGHLSQGFTESNILRLEEASLVGLGNIVFTANPDANVFTVGSATNVNSNTSPYIAYCFHTVPGFSKFSSYRSNNVDEGTYVPLGFRPAWVMVKEIGTADWQILDTKRNTFNVMNEALEPNQSLSTRTTTSSSGFFADFLSDGFMLRGNGGGYNGSSETLIYFAFAEAPFKFSNAR